MNTSRRRFVTSALGFTALTALGSGCADPEATDDEGPDLDDDATCTAEDTGPSKSFDPEQPRAACDPTDRDRLLSVTGRAPGRRADRDYPCPSFSGAVLGMWR